MVTNFSKKIGTFIAATMAIDYKTNMANIGGGVTKTDVPEYST